tara:strand:- start:122 stop:835 length:714 start_codon:yes stop_codon:yes gene_type:complete
MKKSDPIINEMVKSIDYNWDMCNVDLNFITSRLEERSTKEVDYKVLKKLFSFLEDKTRHIEAIELLKEKYSEHYKKYQKEQEQEQKIYEKLFHKLMEDDSKTTDEKYDLILEGLSQKVDVNNYAEMDEWAWLESHKQELAIKKEWIDKETFKVEHTTFKEFDNEDVLRDNIRNAMKKYVDLLSVFDWVYHHDEEYIDEDEIPGDSQQTEMKYEMIKYFDTLCDLRDKFRKSKHAPAA